jgi:hypothetical protein
MHQAKDAASTGLLPALSPTHQAWVEGSEVEDADVGVTDDTILLHVQVTQGPESTAGQGSNPSV